MAAHILFVLRSLADLEAFIKNRENGLLKKVEKGDFQGLVEIMGHLMALNTFTKEDTCTNISIVPMEADMSLPLANYF